MQVEKGFKEEKILTTAKTWSNIRAYFVGKMRYRAYNSRFYKLLVKKHIREQIAFRIKTMNKECYNRGSCIKCGCVTPALQMANKQCEGLCYPIMKTKRQWKEVNQ